jgi:hypothetical protein
VEFENIFPGVFTPVLARHSSSFSLIDCISVGVDRMQRNFEPMRKQVEGWQRSQLTDIMAKVVIYQAFVEGKLRLQDIWLALYAASNSQVREVSIARDLEALESGYVSLQGTGSDSAI